MASDNVQNVSHRMNDNEYEGEDLLWSPEDKEEADAHPTGNPAPPPDVDLELLRGDRIGDTVYSGKWCIELIMKLMKSNVFANADPVSESGDKGHEKSEVVDMDEDLQNQVGVLWDMTGNEDVCVYLHSIGALDSICFVIANSRCPRATEMCAGMLANIITHDVMWQSLHDNSTIYSILVPLLSNEDQPTLLEVTRFFNTALCHSEHSHCYASLYESAGLVLQELARILSGSTQGELLRQTSELTHNLLDLDEEDARFCTTLAEPDFILACVEASREIGYDQASPGQNCMMDVFYRFTTYQTGIEALEPCLKQVAVACSSYLTQLCQHLSLSNTCTTIITTLATLHHVYCRHTEVQEAIAASPRLVTYILKVLVTVYTRLGLYRSISGSHSGHHQREVKDRPRWTDLEDTPTKTDTTGSWSERAFSGAGVSSSGPTPEASPLTRYDNKELEISWSERRVGTPLANQYQDQQWKMPQGNKRVPKKKDFPTSAELRDQLQGPGTEEDSQMDTSDLSLKRDTAGDVKEDEGFDHKNVPEGEDSDKSIPGPKKIDFEVRSNSNTSQASEGFPQPREMDEGESDNNSEDETGERKDRGTRKEQVETESGGDQIAQVSGVGEGGSLSTARFEDSSDGEDKDQDESKTKTESFEAVADSLLTADDKYHKLLATMRDFFTDFLNTLLNASTTESSSSLVKDLITYLNKRCSKTEIRALVKCIGDCKDPSKDLAPSVEKLLALCQHCKASRLEQVVSSCIKRKNK